MKVFFTEAARSMYSFLMVNKSKGLRPIATINIKPLSFVANFFIRWLILVF